MNLSEIYAVFLQNVQAVSWPEWVSTIAQIASVWYASKNNVLVYPTGIIGVLLAAYVYFFMANPPLYADGALNIYYFLMSIYGWYFWLQKKEAMDAYPISWCNRKELIIGLFLFFFFWIGLQWILTNYTNSNTPLLDALVSSSAITAMWWMAKRKIENWLAWLFSNIVAIPLNFSKGFMLFTLMYLLFFILASSAFLNWRKIFASSRK